MMETEFTPFASLAGGILIGISAVLLMAVRGRVFGATGILAGILVPSSSSDWAWRAALLAGMVTGPLAYLAVAGEFPAIEVPISKPMMILGGLIVGLGVTYGSAAPRATGSAAWPGFRRARSPRRWSSCCSPG
jgi:uncharacterized membrane protein YedE/YeeE